MFKLISSSNFLISASNLFSFSVFSFYWKKLNWIVFPLMVIKSVSKTSGSFMVNSILLITCSSLVLYTQTKKLCPLDVYVCQFQMYERFSFKFSHFKLWLFKNDLHLRVIHLIISVAAYKAVNTSTLKIKSNNINNLCVRHHPEPLKHIQTSLNKLSSKISWQVVCFAFMATSISLLHTLTSQNIVHERAWKHSENSLLVQHFDNQQNRTNLMFFHHQTHFNIN